MDLATRRVTEPDRPELRRRSSGAKERDGLGLGRLAGQTMTARFGAGEEAYGRSGRRRDLGRIPFMALVAWDSRWWWHPR